jgi:hypothetical protein
VPCRAQQSFFFRVRRVVISGIELFEQLLVLMAAEKLLQR